MSGHLDDVEHPLQVPEVCGVAGGKAEAVPLGGGCDQQVERHEHGRAGDIARQLQNELQNAVAPPGTPGPRRARRSPPGWWVSLSKLSSAAISVSVHTWSATPAAIAGVVG